MKCQYGSLTFFETERGRPFVPAESCITYKKKEPPTNLTEKPIIEWKVQPAENQKSTGKEKKELPVYMRGERCVLG